MALGLTVVTHIDSSSGRDISPCVKSVKSALPFGAEHLIIDLGKVTPAELYTARYSAMTLNDIVIFVDDDDFISDDSLQRCVDALSETNAGIAFTREVIVRPDNSHLHKSVFPLHTTEVCNSPTVIHHMSAYRTRYVSERSLDLSIKTSVEVQWIMKADAIARAGAIFIPIDGYYWVQHANQWHRRSTRAASHALHNNTVPEELRKWHHSDNIIPVWKI
jgi:hypothetical protein